jgi:hypothetical protein
MRLARRSVSMFDDLGLNVGSGHNEVCSGVGKAVGDIERFGSRRFEQPSLRCASAAIGRRIGARRVMRAQSELCEWDGCDRHPCGASYKQLISDLERGT